MASPSSFVAPSIDWIRSLPKVEMHAHLSGSVRDETIRQMFTEEALAATEGASHEPSSAAAAELFSLSACLSTLTSGERSLSQCFEVFALLHRLLGSLSAVTRVTREVIHDFAMDGVVYLELRTTPRAMPAKGNTPASTKRDYVQTVVDAILEAQETLRTPSGERIIVRLLLSIDRSGSDADAASAVDLAGEFFSQSDSPVVVGIDFSGNPGRSSFRAFEPHFARARTEFPGLRCSVHIGEKEEDGQDLDRVLFHFHPDRIGHVVCIEPRHTDYLLANPTPIEICPTSNLKTKIVQQLHEHPFGTWRAHVARNNQAKAAAKEAGEAEPSQLHAPYPLVICTDDSGVFSITLSDELHKLSEAFEMERDELLDLESRAVEHAFLDEPNKQKLRDIFQRFRASEAASEVQKEAAVEEKEEEQAAPERKAEEEAEAVAEVVAASSSSSAALPDLTPLAVSAAGSEPAAPIASEPANESS